MFNKEKNKIVIMLFENIMSYPPAINLIECLLNNSYKVHLIGEGVSKLPGIVLDDELFISYEITTKQGKDIITRATRRFDKHAQYKAQLKASMNENDILWTLNANVLRALGNDIIPYQNRHIMQLYELLESDTIPYYGSSKLLRFNMKKLSQNAWKNVVCERNRAYIQKVQWNLDKVPYVLPNKPYYFDSGVVNEQMKEAISIIEQEKRKIIMYLGVIDPDRDFESFAKAIEQESDQYCLYMIGKCPKNTESAFKQFCEKYKCVQYLGFFNPPSHLYFLKYAHMAILPYQPGKTTNNTSSLNALYCAPNKIFEYAGCNVPMLGTDVLGLREPFEKYNIGVCCDNLSKEEILRQIHYIDENHNQMIENCTSFYNSVNLDEIINKIIND